jgi:hypothetical protein
MNRVPLALKIAPRRQVSERELSRLGYEKDGLALEIETSAPLGIDS